MEIKDIIEKAVAMLKDNKDLAKRFTAEPAETLNSLGLNIPEDKLKEIIDAVMEKVIAFTDKDGDGTPDGIFGKIALAIKKFLKKK